MSSIQFPSQKNIAEIVQLRKQKTEDEISSLEGKGLKILTPNKLLTRIPILLTQIKAGNNSYNLKNEIRHVLYLLYQHNKFSKKSWQQFNEAIIIMDENMIMGENVIVIKGPKLVCFNFDFPEDLNENWKRENEFIIKSNESLAEIIIKKYKKIV